MRDDLGPFYFGAGLVALLMWLFLWLGSISAYRHFFGPALAPAWTLRRRILFSLISFGVGAGAIIMRISDVDARGEGYRRFLSHGPPELMGDAVGRTQFPTIFLELLCRGLVFVLIIALAAKLYGKWIAGGGTEDEKAPGARGFRAALSLGNVLCVIAIAACAYFGDVLSPLIALMIGLICLLIGPALMILNKAGATPRPAAEMPGLAEQRERVLKLLEAGRINADESAELLNALAASSAAIGPEPMTAHRKLSLIGAALILIGFFIPWYSINLGQEMSRLAGDLSQQMQSMRSEFGFSPDQGQMTANINGHPIQFPQGSPMSTGTIYISGGDVGRGLGWLILGLGVGASLLPYIATGLTAQARRSTMLIALAAGLVIVLYLFTSGLGHVSFGLPIVLVGFILELIAILREMNILPTSPARLSGGGFQPAANHA